MRNLILTVAVLSACGHSDRDVAMAKQARYQGDKMQLFAEMKAGVEGNYKVDVSDETKLAIRTVGRWYTPEGLASSWTPADNGGDRVKLPDKSLNIALVAQLLPEQDRWIVHVELAILRYNLGQAKLEQVRPEDPSLPGFVSGKADELSFDLYKKLKSHEVRSTGGIAPAPTPSGPAPTPDEPTPTPTPEAGSGSAPQ